MAQKQKGIRVTVYMTERVKKMFDQICEHANENMSQTFEALVMQEYYKLKLNEDKK